MFTKRNTGKINWKTKILATNSGWREGERDRGRHDISLNKYNFFYSYDFWRHVNVLHILDIKINHQQVEGQKIKTKTESKLIPMYTTIFQMNNIIILETK